MAWLLGNLFDLRVPDYHHTRAQTIDVWVQVPRTHHTVSMVLFCNLDDRPLLAVVLEVQRGRDRTKWRTWKLYVAHLEAELNVNAALVVYCPDPAVARWYKNMFECEGISLPLRPFVFTPDDVPLVADVQVAQAHPALVVLSAICHGDHAEVDDMFPALAEALRSLGSKRAILYYDVVLAGLPAAARARWEAFMTTTVGYEYRSEPLRKLAALHEPEEARGQRRAVLGVLDERGVPVPEAVREQVLSCTDLAQLDIWLRRAVTATVAEDVIRG
ncbi:MAG TPA: hypothetical protein VFM55_08870 [Micromonosporaceae bacterium]|nr:hypothetical protein [Micromonosporaceae bacterium]